MYNSLFTYVKVNNNKSNNKFKCNIGTRQGCKLATILFILFLNDLIDDLNRAGLTGKQISTDDSEILAIFYAGDMSSASDTARGLQAQTEIISNFYERTGMEINLQKKKKKKKKIIVFRNGDFFMEHERWHFNGQPVETVFSYMGLYVIPKLIWTYAK